MAVIKNNSYIILIFVLCIGFAIIGVNQHNKEELYTEIIIFEGDTLWGLASNHADDMPTDKWIREVIRINDLPNTTIRSGDGLRLPVPKTLGKETISTQMAGDGR